ncbi:MAG TPA: SPOR domain-containing protein [Burkholderiaceae bacterium]|nr:SPOR domain-containing protein [Burkholderiaceae bacterium]
MGLFSFLKGSSASDAQRAGTTDPVQAARTRARRRLIGAAALLAVGVIGFPVLFETQPRPIAVDIPIEIPKKEGAPSLPLPPPRVASAAPATARVSSGVVAERSTEPARESAAAVTRSEPTPGAEPPRKEPAAPRSEPAPKPTPAPKVTPAPEARNDDGARARALLDGRTPASAASVGTKPATVVAAAQTTKPPPSSDAGRFVVQVGAYGEANSARDMRQRVDKLGLKSYTQVVEIDGAKRIRVRVGPFAAREDAEKAAGTLKAAGLPAAVRPL